MRNFVEGFGACLMWVAAAAFMLVLFMIPVTMCLVIARVLWLGLLWALGVA